MACLPIKPALVSELDQKVSPLLLDQILGGPEGVEQFRLVDAGQAQAPAVDPETICG